MNNTHLVVRNVLAACFALIMILIFTVNIYDFCTISRAPLYVNHKESYIKSVSLENASLKCTAVLCIKNLRHEQIECNKIELLLWKKDGDTKSYVAVEATPKSSDLSYISFPGLRSKMIECTFVVSDFDRPLSIDNIDISNLSYR